MSHGERKGGGTSNVTEVTAVFIVLTILINSEVTAKPSTRVESYRTCTKKNGELIGFLHANLTVHKTKSIGLFEGYIKILKKMKPPIPADIFILRCRNSAGKECVTLLKYKHNNVCPFFASGTSNTNTLWRDFVKEFDPPVECPVKQGEYRVNNGTFDGEKYSSYFRAVPGEQSKVTYFVLKVHAKEKDQDLVCIEITFRQVRS